VKYFAAALLCFYFFLAAGAATGLIAADYNTFDHAHSYQQPSTAHWFGTDIFGRNILSRAIQGAGTALAIGFMAALLAVVVGVLLGAVAGYFGGRVDDIVVWIYTTVDSIPYILLLGALAWSLGQGTANVFLALGLTSWVSLCRLVRAEVNKHKNLDYVTAARALGLTEINILFRQIMPNIFHLVVIQFGLIFVAAIKIEVILSFLGLGVEPGTPSWGAMIDEGKQELANGFYWNVIAAGVFFFGLILAVNLLVEAFRSALNPKEKTSYL